MKAGAGQKSVSHLGMGTCCWPAAGESSSDHLTTPAKTKANKKGHIPLGLRKSRQHGVKK